MVVADEELQDEPVNGPAPGQRLVFTRDEIEGEGVLSANRGERCLEHPDTGVAERINGPLVQSGLIEGGCVRAFHYKEAGEVDDREFQYGGATPSGSRR